MKRSAALGIVLAISMIALAGCSGVPHGTSGGGGGGAQNASLAVTMTSTPPAFTNVSVLSATVGITGITLTPSSGTAIALTLSPTVYPVDFMRLQSDTAFLGSLTLPRSGEHTYELQ